MLPEFSLTSNHHLSLLFFGGTLEVKQVVNDGLYKNGNIKKKTIKVPVKIKGLGLTPAAKSETATKGIYSVNEERLLKIKHPIAQKILEMRGLEKQLNTYYASFAELVYPTDGCVHQNYQSCLTATGRSSCVRPNVQNQGGGESPIKQHFVSRFKDGEIVSADYCLAPETKILTTEFRWKPIQELQVGEGIIGFDEHTSTHAGRKFKRGVVLKTKRLLKNCVKLITSEGEIICSKDHMFLATEKATKCSTVWVKAEKLQKGAHIPKVSEVWETPDNNETGWMGGFLDGEGWLSHATSFGFAQNNDGYNKVCLDTALFLTEKYLKNTGIPQCFKKRCVQVRPYGLRTGWQAVGVFQPFRLKQRLLAELETKTSVRSRLNRKAVILDIIDIGIQEVIAVETDCHTFLAEGLLSHNCQLEIRIQAQMCKDEVYMDDINKGVDFHLKRLAMKEGKTYEEVSLAFNSGCQVTKKARSAVKGFSFARAYGAGPKKIAEQTGLSLAEIDKIIKEEAKTYPVLDKWNAYNKETVERQGYYTDPWGQRYCFTKYPNKFAWQTGTESYNPNEMLNYIIQGFATGIVVFVMIGIFWRQKALYNRDRYLMINTVHDSLMLDCKKTYLRQAAKDLTILEDVGKVSERDFNYKFIVPIKVDIEAGKTWYDLKKLTF